jgi:hypothetical protein
MSEMNDFPQPDPPYRYRPLTLHPLSDVENYLENTEKKFFFLTYFCYLALMSLYAGAGESTKFRANLCHVGCVLIKSLSKFCNLSISRLFIYLLFTADSGLFACSLP